MSYLISIKVNDGRTATRRIQVGNCVGAVEGVHSTDKKFKVPSSKQLNATSRPQQSEGALFEHMNGREVK